MNVQMANSLPETVAAMHAGFLAKATKAEKKAADGTDATLRKEWTDIADSYRDLAAGVLWKITP